MVQAAGTDAWAEVRQRVARLLGQGSHEGELDELQRLDRTAAAVVAAGEDATVIREAAIWQVRFETLLERLDGAERTDAAAELRALADRISARSRTGGGVLSGNVFHGPTAVQTGNGNRQDNRFDGGS